MDFPYIFEIIDAATTMIMSALIVLIGISVYRIHKKLKELALKIEWLSASFRIDMLPSIEVKKKRGRPKRKNPA